MKIAIYFFRLHQSVGGAEKMACCLASAMSDRGHDVHLISLDAETEDQCFYPLHVNVTWHRVGSQGGLRGKINRIQRLVRILKVQGIQALVGFVMSGDKTIYAAAQISQVPLIVAERNAPSMYHIKYSRMQRWLSFSLMFLADRICVQDASFVEGYWSLLRSKITTIPNPVMRQSIVAAPSVVDRTGKYKLLYVGRLDYSQKGLGCLLNAFAFINKEFPDWQVEIVGDGADLDMLQSTAVKNGIEKQVKFLPAQKNLEEVFVGANLFVLPSLWEGFPNALAEAMSHGLPAVGFADASGVSNLISGGGGWLAEGVGDSEALARALSCAMSSHEERQKRGTLARDRMRMFSPDVQFDRWEGLFVSCLPKDL